MFVVVDPHWGDPQPIPDTEAATAEEAIEKAIRHRDHALWSGASEFPLPHGTPGKWSRLQEQGYRVEFLPGEAETGGE